MGVVWHWYAICVSIPSFLSIHPFECPNFNVQSSKKWKKDLILKNKLKNPPTVTSPQHRVWGWRKGKYQMGGPPKEASKDRCALM